MRPRGFSLVECLVAATLLSGGALSLNVSFGAVQRLALLGQRTAGATLVAASRFELLRTTACVAPVAGATPGVYAERWSVVVAGRLRRASLDVAFVHDHRLRTVHFQADFRCPDP